MVQVVQPNGDELRGAAGDFVAQLKAAEKTEVTKKKVTGTRSKWQKLFKAAKKTKEALTKDAFAVLCFDAGDEENLEVLEVLDDGCKRFLSVCKGVTKEKLMNDHLDLDAMDSIEACMNRILDKAGEKQIAGISCDVGYLWLKHQRTIRQAFPQIPVLLTPLMQLPFVSTCFGAKAKTVVVTWDDAVETTTSHLDSGITDTDRVELLTLNADRWWRFLAKRTTSVENQELLDQLVGMVKHIKDVHSILLDSMLSPFRHALSAATGLPIFDEVSLLKLFGAAVSLSHFSDASVLCRLKNTEKAQRKATKGLGRTFRNSGSPLGLVRLEHDYVAGVGDIDHPNTFPFESCPAIVPGLTFEEAQHGSQDPKILEKLKCVVKEMEAENCFGIAGNCGFMHFYQQFVRDYATVPVFMSALVQVPLMAAALEPDERILILTANASSFMESRDALLSADRPFCDFNRVLVRGCEHVPGFEAVANADLVDNIKVQENLVKYVQDILENEKKNQLPIKSILLECTQMPHYAAAIRQSTGLPVFDVVTCVNFFAPHEQRPEQ